MNARQNMGSHCQSIGCPYCSQGIPHPDPQPTIHVGAPTQFGMPPKQLTLEDVERLLANMVSHNVIELSFGGLTVRRMPSSEAVRPGPNQSILEQLEKLPPDAQDAALMLQRRKAGAR